jgi:hypothetical protein
LPNAYCSMSSCTLLSCPMVPYLWCPPMTVHERLTKGYTIESPRSISLIYSACANNLLPIWKNQETKCRVFVSPSSLWRGSHLTVIEGHSTYR